MGRISLLLLLCFLLLGQFACKKCECTDIKLTITGWVCKGNDSNGYLVYEGNFSITNNSKCEFKLTEIMQQAGGDVQITLPLTVASGVTSHYTILYTDLPPFSETGVTPYFIVVYTLNDVKCKVEFASQKLPVCDEKKCNCADTKLTITEWTCKESNSSGYPVYEGKLSIANNSKCEFRLTEIMQQTGGDVRLTLPVTVAAGVATNYKILYTDVPPFSPAGSTPYFIVVYALDNVTCKVEFGSQKLPVCDKK